ncbi:unnamed protein product [Taenia asiatica]|uniref:WHEP-TRS domain-containing protein n=1 Tax=Taenia asiatica TaxID=60517 RepID=A0A0R3VT74_TAEAS|nr:unnamed protein product [Taenia asiatica]
MRRASASPLCSPYSSQLEIKKATAEMELEDVLRKIELLEKQGGGSSGGSGGAVGSAAAPAGTNVAQLREELLRSATGER